MAERSSERRVGSALFGGCVCGSHLVSAGASGAGSACAFGIMDHLSLKVCAAAGFTCIPIHAEIIAIAILERRLMIAPHKQVENAKSWGCVPAQRRIPALAQVKGEKIPILPSTNRALMQIDALGAPQQGTDISLTGCADERRPRAPDQGARGIRRVHSVKMRSSSG